MSKFENSTVYSLLGLWIGQRQDRNYGFLHFSVQISNVSKEPCYLVLVPSPKYPWWCNRFGRVIMICQQCGCVTM